MTGNNNDSTYSNVSLVLGFLAIKDIAGIENQVRVLARLGYDNLQIATICDVTPASVRTHKYEGKKKTGAPVVKKKTKK